MQLRAAGRRGTQRVWPLVVLKELVDNTLDAAEKAGVPPQISVSVADGVIAAQDNGPGIPIRTVKGPLAFITTLTTAKLTCASTCAADERLSTDPPIPDSYSLRERDPLSDCGSHIEAQIRTQFSALGSHCRIPGVC